MDGVEIKKTKSTQQGPPRLSFFFCMRARVQVWGSGWGRERWDGVWREGARACVCGRVGL